MALAVEDADRAFVSVLDEKSKKKAKEELHETNDKDRDIAVQTFRKWVLDQDWLKSPTDFPFLLKFLRVRKFSQLLARKTLENYWTVRSSCPAWFSNVDPADPVIQEIFRTGFRLSPMKTDSQGRRLALDRPGQLLADTAKKTWGIDYFFKARMLFNDWICYDENAHANGAVVLFDLSEVPFSDVVTVWTAENGKRQLKYAQKCQPCRLKGTHVYKEPGFFDAVYSIFKPMLTAKTIERLHLHGSSMVKVYKHIDKHLLPDEYLPDDYTGPSAGPISKIVEAMIEDMNKPYFREYIKDLSSGTYGVDAKKRNKTEDVKESFRRLNVE